MLFAVALAIALPNDATIDGLINYVATISPMLTTQKNCTYNVGSGQDPCLNINTSPDNKTCVITQIEYYGSLTNATMTAPGGKKGNLGAATPGLWALGIALVMGAIATA